MSVSMKHNGRKETVEPVAVTKGNPNGRITGNERNGTANLFIPWRVNRIAGWRHLKVTERRTAIDYAYPLKDAREISITLMPY